MRLWKAKALLKDADFYALITGKKAAFKRMRKHYLRQSKKRPRMASTFDPANGQHQFMTRSQKRRWLKARAKETR